MVKINLIDKVLENKYVLNYFERRKISLLELKMFHILLFPIISKIVSLTFSPSLMLKAEI